MVKCRSWIHSLSPSGDSVPSGPALSKLASSSGFSLSSSLFHERCGPLLRLCCWSTCMGSSLRCDLALRNRSNFVFRSCIYLTFAFAFVPTGSFVLVTLPIRFAALGALLSSFHSSVVSSATRPFISSLRRCHVPDQFGPKPIAQTSSYHMSLLVSWSLCVVLASCAPTFR